LRNNEFEQLTGEIMNNKYLKLILRAGFLAATLFMLGAAANAQKGTSVVRRVKFARGSSAAVIGGRVQRGVSNDYLVTARAGQDASFYLQGGAGVTFTLISPDGEILADYETGWMGALPASGTYRVNVLPDTTTNRAKSYKLTIRINQ
jgi:hypothetical protein